MSTETDCQFSCPHCMTKNVFQFDHTAGQKQEFTVDCEICCRPIHIIATANSDLGVDLVIKKES